MMLTNSQVLFESPTPVQVDAVQEEIEEKLKAYRELYATVRCTCESERKELKCNLAKKGKYKYYQVDVQELQKANRKVFSCLSSIHAELYQRPNIWFSRPQVAKLCEEKSKIRSNSLLNSLTKEIISAFNSPISYKHAIKEIMDGYVPDNGGMFIAVKVLGRPNYAFIFIR